MKLPKPEDYDDSTPEVNVVNPAASMAQESPSPPMTSTQVRYASHGTSDIATEPKGPYGPNMDHERYHAPQL